VPDSEYLTGLQPFVEKALEILRCTPSVDRVVGRFAFADFDGNSHTSPECSVLYEGTHADEDLDTVPAARRLERTAASYLSMVPFNIDPACGYQETLSLSIDRTGAALKIHCVDAPYERTISWSHPGFAQLRKFIKVVVRKGVELTAHQKMEMLTNPARHFEKLLIPYAHRKLLKPIAAKAMDDNTYIVELSPSTKLLSKNTYHI